MIALPRESKWVKSFAIFRLFDYTTKIDYFSFLVNNGLMFPWLSFLSYIIIVTYTPGPNNIMTMNIAKNEGFKKSLKFVFGVFVGAFILMVLCMLFSAFLYSAVPKIQLPMKILGAAYMTFLIVKTLVPKKKEDSPGDKKSNVNFFIGITLQFINPKAILYGITTMSSFILPYYNQIPILLLFALLLAFVGLTGLLVWALFGSLFSVLFNKHGKILNIFMALLLVYCIVSLFI